MYCSNCGNRTRHLVPDGDERPRDVCPQCGTIHYQNPKMVVGCIVEDHGRILLCRRSIEPRSGLWTVPAGYLENGETSAQGAIRETMEESGAVIDRLKPYRLFDLPSIDQLYLLFRARLISCPYQATSESSEVALFPLDDLPWQDMAFAIVKTALAQYLDDSLKQQFAFANHVISL